jgi:hypothetical protein
VSRPRSRSRQPVPELRQWAGRRGLEIAAEYVIDGQGVPQLYISGSSRHYRPFQLHRLNSASGFDACVPAPDALTVGQVSELAGNLLAVQLVIPTDLPDESAGALADMRAPCPELIVGRGGRRWLGVEDVLRILLKQRIEAAAGAEVA